MQQFIRIGCALHPGGVEKAYDPRKGIGGSPHQRPRPGHTGPAGGGRTLLEDVSSAHEAPLVGHPMGARWLPSRRLIRGAVETRQWSARHPSDRRGRPPTVNRMGRPYFLWPGRSATAPPGKVGEEYRDAIQIDGPPSSVTPVGARATHTCSGPPLFPAAGGSRTGEGRRMYLPHTSPGSPPAR